MTTRQKSRIIVNIIQILILIGIVTMFLLFANSFFGALSIITSAFVFIILEIFQRKINEEKDEI